MLQRKNFVPFYKKKKVPSNFIDRFPVQQIFSRDDPFYHRANQCYHMPLNIRKLQSMKRIFLLFFFFQISHVVPFPREISLNFRSSIYDYFLYPTVDSPFSYPIEYQKITFRREQTVAFFSSKRILLNFSLKFRFDLQIRSCNCRPSTNIVENVFSLSLSPPPSFTRREVSTRNVTALPVARRFRINCNVNEPSWALVNGPIRAPFLHCFADPRLRSLVN